MKPSTYFKNLQLSTNWRAQYNPLRGLTIRAAGGDAGTAERGNYARLQWLYRFVEKRNSTLRAVLQRRQASMTRLDWDIRVRGCDNAPSLGDRRLPARQAAVLREAYERIENLREAVTFLALAEFRGYAHLERHFDAAGAHGAAEAGAAVVLGAAGARCAVAIQRDGAAGPADAAGSGAGCRSGLFVREIDSPIDEIAVIAHVRQSLSQKDWDGFVETYGLPPLFLELPPDIPAEREAEYQAQAEAIIGDARGTVPHGTQIHTVDSGARGQNPFAEHLRYQDELIVLAATGGKLTALTESGSGTLAGGAHQRAFDDITEAEAALISEVFQRQFDAPLLGEDISGAAAAGLFRAGRDARRSIRRR